MITAQLVMTKTLRGREEYWYWRLYDTKKNKYLFSLGKHPLEISAVWNLLNKKSLELSEEEEK